MLPFLSWRSLAQKVLSFRRRVWGSRASYQNQLTSHYFPSKLGRFFQEKSSGFRAISYLFMLRQSSFLCSVHKRWSFFILCASYLRGGKASGGYVAGSQSAPAPNI